MDIYAYAKEINYSADYYDFHTGLIYGITEYGRCLKFGLPTKGIPVYENGTLISYARES